LHFKRDHFDLQGEIALAVIFYDDVASMICSYAVRDGALSAIIRNMKIELANCTICQSINPFEILFIVCIGGGHPLVHAQGYLRRFNEGEVLAGMMISMIWG
jgi:hypothetical protein